MTDGRATRYLVLPARRRNLHALELGAPPLLPCHPMRATSPLPALRREPAPSPLPNPLRDVGGAVSGLRWRHIVRIGLVQASIGAVVVMMTSTLNRVMVVELALPALVPGTLVMLHNIIQFALRPSMGHGSDLSGRREGWIIGGMALLALSGVGAAASAAWIDTARPWGLAASALCFLGIGTGVSAAATPLLALLAERVAPARRARASALVWILMIAGFIVTTRTAGHFLAPFSWDRLVQVVGGVCAVAFVVAVLAVRGLERSAPLLSVVREAPVERGLLRAVRLVWADPAPRAFCWFITLAMFAYSAQDLILEPFAGVVFGMTPGQSTATSGIHQAGLLAGMLGAAALAPRFGTSAGWASAGCVVSAVFFALLAASPTVGSVVFFKSTLFGLGLGNGAFTIGALASMMALTADDTHGRAGLRMGVFGAAQAVAMGSGNFLGAVGSDAARLVLGSSTAGYVVVFAIEGVLFALAARFALRAASRSEWLRPA